MPLTGSRRLFEHQAVAPAAVLGADGWATWHAAIWRPPISRDAVCERLLDLTEVVREWLVDTRRLAVEWAPLGIEVRTARIRARGFCSPGDDSRVVYVNAADPYELQRFTVAHEVAHLLLGDARSRRRRTLSPPAEEALCDEFAGRLLIDRAALATRLHAAEFPPAPADLLRLCGEFRVNARPIVIAVGEHLRGTPYQLLLARWRGHRRRPAELAFRVEGFAGDDHVYFPRDQRLISLGLRSLATQAQRVSHGDGFDGRDDVVTIGLRNLPAERTSGAIQRRVSWQALRLGHSAPFLLAVLEVSGGTSLV